MYVSNIHIRTYIGMFGDRGGLLQGEFDRMRDATFLHCENERMMRRLLQGEFDRMRRVNGKGASGNFYTHRNFVGRRRKTCGIMEGVTDAPGPTVPPFPRFYGSIPN